MAARIASEIYSGGWRGPPGVFVNDGPMVLACSRVLLVHVVVLSLLLVLLAGIMTHHVGYTLLFEQALQVVDPVVSVPYWEYTIEGA